MVTYTLIPYSVIYEAGLIQQKILDELMTGLDSADLFDAALASTLIEKYLAPFNQQNNIQLV